VPFIFLTGGSMSDETRRFPDVPVIGKPFDSDGLLAALAKVMVPKH
jgi:hypothetical protein